MKKIEFHKQKNQNIRHTGPQNSDLACTFPTVGIGASAGGLETFTQLLKELPCDTGMAFVLIQHLDPSHESFLTEALTKATQMPVHEIEDGMKLKPNHVFVIPPGSDIGILRGSFTLFPRDTAARRPHMAIDFFFRALASECGGQAIGVVLSGTATDGTEGLRAIKAENGVSLVQDPKTAKFSGMPQSAVNADVVDFCLDIPMLAAELVRLSEHPYISGRISEPLSGPKDAQDLEKVFVLLRTSVAVDFSQYKPPTIKRRLSRRMALLKIEGLANYIKFLQNNPEEIKLLAQDVLIHVTSFFRDPAVFEKLQTAVFPEIIKNKPSGTPVRIWVSGCSSGEEVYSIAISLLEFLGENASKFPIQMFGSDLSERMIERARAGFYSESAVQGVGPEQLRRFFVKVEDGYRISKLVRDLCVFVRHDLARDPPFSKLDLVTCRNVLIYFEQPLQKSIISTFHYCLNQPGFLLLGRTENISAHQHLFSSVDKANKIFLREPVTSQLEFSSFQKLAADRQPFQPKPMEPVRSSLDMAKLADNLLLSRYAPAGAVVNERYEVLQYRGQTGRYLEAPPGQPEINLLKMVREGLFSTVKVALTQAKKKMTVVRNDGVGFKSHGISQTCNLVVIPFTKLPESKEPLFLVLFEDVVSTPLDAKAKPSRTKHRRLQEEKESLRSERLERELHETKDYLHSFNEEHQKVNDALNSLNEELVSGNEELQSMNEELETAKEELQSTNEELTTVNDELQNRNQETSSINDDLINLLNSVEIPILILDLNRRIRRFTPKARKIMNLVPTDVGRSIDDIKTNILISDLDQQIQEVTETVTTKELEVQDQDGRWHRLQIRPYKTLDNRITGTVLSLIDINTLRSLVTESQDAKVDADKANITKDLFLAMLSHELRTPLTSMILQAQMLKRGVLDETRVKKAASDIERAAKMQAQLIEDLLDVSRIVTGKLKMEVRPVNLAETVRTALGTVSALAENKSVILESLLDDSVEKVSGDPIRLQQVIWNLLTNAIKFSPKGEKITVSLKALDGHAQIQVIDNGIGISPEFLPQVFKRFSQAEGTITRAHGGLGLGLAIVRHLVEMHDGNVRVESAGKNKGATFTVTLPMMKTLSAGNESKDLNAKIPSNRNSQKHKAVRLDGIRILIVEDDLGAREAITDILRDAGADVQAASSAPEAMEVLKEFKPDELVLDIAMPGEDGYSLLRRIRKLGPIGGKTIPALALTALASDKDREEAFSAGFQMHLAKPIDIDRLTGALHDLVEKGKQVH